MMGIQTIHRAIHNPDNPYVMTKRESAQDTGLSYEATGMLVFLLSKPDDWQIIPQTLVRDGCTLKRVYAIFKELIDAKYMTRDGVRNERGQFVEWSYKIFEHPQKKQDEPLSQNPQHGQSMTWDSHQVESPHDGFSAPLQNKDKEVQNTDIPNTEKDKTTTGLPVNPEPVAPATAIVSSIGEKFHIRVYYPNLLLLPANVPEHPDFKAKDFEAEPPAQPGPEQGKVSITPPPNSAPPPAPPAIKLDTKFGRVVTSYHENIGLTISPTTNGLIGCAVDEYPEDWILDAIWLAVQKKKRFWGFVDSTLSNWGAQGYKDLGKFKPPEREPVGGEKPLPRRAVDDWFNSMAGG